MDKLRNFVKQTLLLPADVKNRLLGLDKWSDELKQLVKDFYDRYYLKEEKILDLVNKRKNDFYIKTLKIQESKHREKEIKQLQEIENKLNKMS